MAYDPTLGYNPQHWNGHPPAPAGCRLLKHGEHVSPGTPYYVYSPTVRKDTFSFKRVGNGWLHCCNGYSSAFIIGTDYDSRNGPYAVRERAVELHEDEGG